MTDDNPVGFAAAVHDYYAHYTDNADAKAGALLTADFAVGALLLSNLPLTCAARAAAWLAVGLLSASVLGSLHALFPRLPGRGAGLIFWEDVHRLPSAFAYSEAVAKLSPEEIEAAWATNAFHVAGVLHR